MAQAGDKFPAFTAQSQDDKPIDLAAHHSGKNLVAFFYPKANTPG